MTPELQALTQRLEDVERQVAHLEALAVEHSDTDRTEEARTINARRFVVTDARGVRRAELSMMIPPGEAEEHPWLEFYGGNPKSAVGLRADDHGRHIGLFYRDRRPAAHRASSLTPPRPTVGATPPTPLAPRNGRA